MFIGADLGGRHARAGLVENGRILQVSEREHSGNLDALAALDAVVREVRGRRPIFSIGIAVPGLYDDTTLVRAGNLQSLEGVDFDRYGVPVILRHDITAFRIGEERYGLAKGYASVNVQNFGTGWSACFSDAGISNCRGKEQHDCTKRTYSNWNNWDVVQHTVGAQNVLANYRANGGTEKSLEAIWNADDPIARETRRNVERAAAELLKRTQAIHPADIHIYSGGQAARLVPSLHAAFPQLNIVASDNYVQSAILGAAYAARAEMQLPRKEKLLYQPMLR